MGDAVSVSAKVKKGFKFCSRILLHGQETLEDYDSCGIFGDEGNRASYRPNRARIGDDYECLWDCEWQLNPFYKSSDLYFSKLGMTQEKFPIYHTSPQVPKDLTCLDDCFGFYKNPRNDVMMKKRNQKRAQCSANGLDTLVPTHHEDGLNFEASHYSDMDLWWSTWIGRPDWITTIGSWNPNLDCLMFLESISIRRGDHVGNFIPCGNAPQQGVTGGQKRGNRTRTFRGSGSNENCLPAEGSRILRASNPLSTAVEICAFAKWLQFKTHFSPQWAQELPEIMDFSFTAEAPGCDHFLPDLFSPVKCRCVGTCAPATNPVLTFDSDFPNAICDYDKDAYDYFSSSSSDCDYVNGTFFTTEPGLMGCQSACEQFSTCKFFTFSLEPSLNVDGTSSISKKHVCRLWDSCESYEIPADSTYSFDHQEAISLHWSGPKTCDGQRTSCPLLPLPEVPSYADYYADYYSSGDYSGDYSDSDDSRMYKVKLKLHGQKNNFCIAGKMSLGGEQKKTKELSEPSSEKGKETKEAEKKKEREENEQRQKATEGKTKEPQQQQE